MVNKTPLGISTFDNELGGVYRGRPVLCCGRAKSGKTPLAFHFIDAGLKNDEKVLVMSNANSRDSAITSQSLGFNFFETAVESQQMMVLESAPDYELGEEGCLPPEAFETLKETVESNGISRVVFDTAVPWLAIKPIDKLQKHVYSFMEALDALAVTTLFTLPKPKSNAAFILRKFLEHHCPVSIFLDVTPEGRHTFRLSKYLGHARAEFVDREMQVVAGKGLVLEDYDNIADEELEDMDDENYVQPAPRFPIRSVMRGIDAANPRGLMRVPSQELHAPAPRTAASAAAQPQARPHKKPVRPRFSDVINQ
jgi:RecA-superfamily ATPases implicated in signal transduction